MLADVRPWFLSRAVLVQLVQAEACSGVYPSRLLTFVSSKDVKGFNVSGFELCKFCGLLWKGGVRWCHKHRLLS